jgi:hypothetical protein
LCAEATVYETVGGPSDVEGLATDGDLLGRAVSALERLGAGTCTAGEAAAIAAEVIKNPPPVIRAAQRYLAALGQAHEGAAAVELLRLVLEAGATMDEPDQHEQEERRVT